MVIMSLIINNEWDTPSIMHHLGKCCLFFNTEQRQNIDDKEWPHVWWVDENTDRVWMDWLKWNLCSFFFIYLFIYYIISHVHIFHRCLPYVYC